MKSPLAPAAGPANGPVHRDRNFVIGWNHGSIDFRGAAALSVAGNWYAASFGSLQGNTWYHLAATYDGENLRAFKDGVLVTDNSLPSGVPDFETNSLKLGRHATEPQFFTGLVDEIRIYDRALSAAEIQAVFEGEVDPCADGAGCDDGNACTTGDTCAGGVCQGGPALACGDGNALPRIHANPASGCVHTALACNDGNACTNDSCNPASGCVHTPNTASCNDGNACTTGDTCGGGACNPGPPLVCNDGNPNTKRHVRAGDRLRLHARGRHRPRRPLAV